MQTSVNSQDNTMSTSAPVSTLTAVTEEEVAMVRCTSPKEAVKYEKDLRKAAETAVERLQKGKEAPGGIKLDDVMRDLVAHFKTKMKIPFKPAAKVSRKSVLNMITDKTGHCIWDTLEELDNDEMMRTSQLKQRQVPWSLWTGLSLYSQIEEDLMEDQAKCIIQLFKSHCIMIEHQA